MKFKNEIQAYLQSNLSSDMRKRLRPNIQSNSAYRQGNNYVGLHIPAYINIDVDNKFEITTNGITVSIKNKKCVVSIWIDERVPAQVTIY